VGTKLAAAYTCITYSNKNDMIFWWNKNFSNLNNELNNFNKKHAIYLLVIIQANFHVYLKQYLNLFVH